MCIRDSIYLNEDGDSNDVWQLDPATGQVVQIANGQSTETSGIKDISDLVGFTAGSIFLTNSYDGNSINGNNGSLYMLVSPTASRSVLLGDLNLDGTVNLLDIDAFVDLLSSGGFQAEGDTNLDGAVNLLDIGPFIEIIIGN